MPDVDGLIGDYSYPETGAVVPLASLREVEKEIVVYDDDEKYNNIAVFDLRKNTKL